MATARLTAKNPEGMAVLNELTAIRESTVSMTNHALAEIRDVVPDADAVVVK
jgi:hypothetical protein